MSSVISIAIGPIGLLIAAIPLYKTFKNVKSWKDVKEIGVNFYSGFKILARGNYELGKIIFTYFASLRILNLKEYETRHQEKLLELKAKEQELEEHQLELDAEDVKITEITEEMQVLTQKLNKKQIELERQKELARMKTEALNGVKKEKLILYNTINEITEKIQNLSH